MKKFLCLILSTVMLACAYSLPTVFAEEAESVYKENGKWKTCAESVSYTHLDVYKRQTI